MEPEKPVTVDHLQLKESALPKIPSILRLKYPRNGKVERLKAILKKDTEASLFFSDPREDLEQNSHIKKFNFGIPVTLKSFIEIHDSLCSISTSSKRKENKLFLEFVSKYAFSGNVPEEKISDLNELAKLVGYNGDTEKLLTISKESLELRAVLKYLFSGKPHKNLATVFLTRNQFEEEDDEKYQVIQYKRPEEKKKTTHDMEEVNKLCKDYLTQELKIYEIAPTAQNLILKSFDLAAYAHYNHRRGSGDPYIFHPLAVALSAIKSGVREPKVIGGLLLHDVVEDQAERVANYFGNFTFHLTKGLFPDESESAYIDAYIMLSEELCQNISQYVRELTKSPSKDKNNPEVKKRELRETFDKLAKTEDPSVILGKCRDRLNNLQTIDGLKSNKFMSTAIETALELLPLLDSVAMDKMRNPKARQPTPEEIIDAKRLKSLLINEILNVGEQWVLRLHKEFSLNKWSVLQKPSMKNYLFSVKDDAVASLIDTIASKQIEFLNEVEKIYPDIKNDLSSVMESTIEKIRGSGVRVGDEIITI